MQNPEYYTIWNIRRRVLLYGIFPTNKSGSMDQVSIPHSSHTGVSHGEKSHVNVSVIQSDLDFTFPLLVKWPKCYWIWNFRLWLLEKANDLLECEVARALWLTELGFVAKMLSKDSRNFHGWGYRRHVVAQLESSKLGGRSMVEEEFEYSTRMISVALKNFSAWHYRSRLIPQLMDHRSLDYDERKNFINAGRLCAYHRDRNRAKGAELDLIWKAIWADQAPYDQSSWFYYQFLMKTIIEGNSDIARLSRDDQIEELRKQLLSIKDFLDGGEDCKWAYDVLMDTTLALCRLEARSSTDEEARDLQSSLHALKSLDTMRTGRWSDTKLRIDSACT